MKYGKLVLRLLWLGALLGCSGVTQEFLESMDNPMLFRPEVKVLEPVESVIFEEAYKDNTFFVPFLINGEYFQIFVDTGWDDGLNLSREALSRLGLLDESLPVGEPQFFEVKAEIGPYEIHFSKGLLLDEATFRGVDGVVGHAFLKFFKVRFNAIERAVELSINAASDEQAIPLEQHNQIKPIYRVKVEGQEVPAMIDTGNNGSNMVSPGFHYERLSDQDHFFYTRGFDGYDWKGDSIEWKAFFQAGLEIGDFELQKQNFGVASWATSSASIILGMDTLRALEITINYPKREEAFSSSGGATNNLLPTLPFTLGENMTVRTVFEKWPGEWDVQVGDTMVTPLSEYNQLFSEQNDGHYTFTFQDQEGRKYTQHMWVNF